MNSTASTAAPARSDVLRLAILVTGAVAATVIAWGLVHWAQAPSVASCVVPGPKRPAVCTTSGPATGRTLIAAVLSVVFGAMAAALPQLLARPARAPHRRPSPARSAAPRQALLVPPPIVPPAAPLDAVRAIVTECIELLDRRDPALDDAARQQLERALAESGCSPFDPTGRAFDRQAHRAVDRIVTHDAATAGTVAMTERLGWRCNDRLIRPAEVVVNVAADR